MTPNDIRQEFRDQLRNHGLPAESIDVDMDAHKRRRDAAIESATSTMTMRVLRAENDRRPSLTRSRLPQMALAMTVATAAIILVMVVPQRNVTQSVADTTRSGLTPLPGIERDVDALTDRLVQRNGSIGSTWAVTDDDVDQLLGDADLDL